MNVLVISRYFYPFIGGNENQCYLLADQLSMFGVSSTVITGRHKKSLKKIETIGTVRVRRLNYLNITFAFSKRNAYTRIYNGMRFFISEWSFLINLTVYLLLNAKRYEIIHVHKANWITIPALVLGKFHNIPVLVKEATFFGPSQMSLLWLPRCSVRFLYKNSNFISVSSAIRNNLKMNGVNDCRIFEIPNGIKLPDSIESIREPNTILFVGNYWDRWVKGLDILLSAVNLLIRDIPDLKLFIIGDGDAKLFNSFYDLYLLNQNIFFLGQQQEVNEWYRRCSVYVSSSRSEGLSNSLLEAMANKMACIATNISGSADMICNHYNGILVEPGNIILLYEAIRTLIQNPSKRTEYGKSAFITIEKSYKIEYITQRYFLLYKELISKHT